MSRFTQPFESVGARTAAGVAALRAAPHAAGSDVGYGPAKAGQKRKADATLVRVFSDTEDAFDLFQHSELSYQIRTKDNQHAPIFNVGDLVRVLHGETTNWCLCMVQRFETLVGTPFGSKGSIGMRLVRYDQLKAFQCVCMVHHPPLILLRSLVVQLCVTLPYDLISHVGVLNTLAGCMY